MASKRKKPATVVTLEVCGDRTVKGHTRGDSFTVDLGPEQDPDDIGYDVVAADARVADVRQIRAWIAGGHVRVVAGGELIDPVYATVGGED